jgi:uncharacterized protein
MVRAELLCAGLLALLLFGLGLAVSVERGRAGRLGGIPDDHKSLLFRLIRAHGNAAEYVPAAIAFALYFAVSGASAVATALILCLTLARYIHAAALVFGRDMSRFGVARFIGGMGTYVTGLGLAAVAITTAF